LFTRLPQHAGDAVRRLSVPVRSALLLMLLFGLAGPAGLARADDNSLELQVGGTSLAVSADAGVDLDRSRWQRWLSTALQAAGTVTGRFPRERVVVRLSPSDGRSGPVAFGRIHRGRPPRIRFWVSPRANPQRLLTDWRAYHEFAHLLIPFPGNRDIWFTEGLASYYQYLLQARIGVIGERDAWRALLAGFERGRTDPAGRGRSLRALSPEMWRESAFKRVYWTGAAFFLRVDVRLRSETDGRHSLDSTLAAFHRCCLAADRRWRAADLVERLGELSVPAIWREEYRRSIDTAAVPAPGGALQRLGIHVRGAGVVFEGNATQRELRAAIAGRRPVPLQSPEAFAP
jgi:hypothetical protein